MYTNNKSCMSRRLSDVGHNSQGCIQASPGELANLDPCRGVARVCDVSPLVQQRPCTPVFSK